MGVFIDTIIHILVLFTISIFYYFSIIRNISLYVILCIWHPSKFPSWVKRWSLIILYLDVPIVRKSIVQWGIARIFPGFIQECVVGTLKTTAFTMQTSSIHSPFLFIPSLRECGPFYHNRIRSKMPWLQPIEQATTAIAAELCSLLEAKEVFPEFFGTWHTFDFYLYGKHAMDRANKCPVTAECLESIPSKRAVL